MGKMCAMREVMLSAKEFAEKVGRPYPTVALWLRQGRIPGAQQVQVGSWTVWEIPAAALKNFASPQRGRPKQEPAAKVTKRKAVKNG